MSWIGPAVQVTARVDYALQAMVALAEADAAPMPTNVLAEQLELSYNYLLSIVGELRRAGFVTMRRGSTGGLQLARPAAAITLGEIIDAIDGPLTLADGSQPETAADRSRAEYLPSLWVAAHRAMLDVFSCIPLSEARAVGVGTDQREVGAHQRKRALP